jgi:nucleoside-diphosphate-sugar epimerase
VRAGSRHGRDIAKNIQAVRVDVLHPSSLDAALVGVDAVVHCAVGPRATTLTGTQNVIEAAQRAVVRRVVHLSSVAVYGDAAGRVTETTPILPCPPSGGGYAQWKAGAEALCRRATGLSVVMLRPSIVYGVGSEPWIAHAARRIEARRWGTLGAAGEGVCNPVHVTDVAEAVLAALRADVAHGEAFNINGPEHLTWNAWFTRLAQALGHAALPDISPPAWRRRSQMALPIKALVRALPVLRAPFAQYLLGAPAASELALFRLNATYPIDKAHAQLHWWPHMSLADGLADAMAWMRAQGCVS